VSSTPQNPTPPERPAGAAPPAAPAHPHRGRRLLTIVLASLAGLVLAVVFTLAFLLGTQSGARFLFGRLGALLPGSFEVAGVQGPIRGPLALTAVVYKRPGMEVRIDHLSLAWRPAALLRRQLDVESLAAQGVHVLKTPAPPTNQPFKLPDLNLRFNIIVRDAQVRDLTVTSAAGSGSSGSPAAPAAAANPAPLVIDRIDLATTERAGVFHVDRLTVRSPQVNADVSGTLEPRGAYPVDLAARWSVQPQGMAPVAGGGTLSGTLESLRVAQAIETPFPVRLTALLTEPFQTLGFDARVDFRDLDPRRLKASLPALTASGSVTAKGNLDDFTSAGTVSGSLPQTGPLAIAYALARQGGETYRLDTADVTFPGTPTRLQAAGRFTLADAPAGQKSGQKPGQKLEIDATVSWRSLAWPPRGTPSFASAAGQAKIAAAGAPEAFTGTVALRAAVAPVGEMAADLRLARAGDTFRLERGDITLPGTAARITAQGAVTETAGKPLALNARASWREVQWPLRGKPLARSAAGQAEVAGNLDDYSARLAADLAGAPGGQIPPGHWTVAGRGSKSSFRLAALGADLLGGHVAGSGTVGWSPHVSWDLALSGQGLNPGVLRPDFPGSLSLAARTRGRLEPAGPAGTVDLERLGGTLRGQPIGGSAAVRLAGKRYDLPHVDLSWGGAKLAASGTVGDRLDLAYRASVPNLGLALPQASGAVNASGRVAGALRAPRVVTDATIAGLRYQTAGGTTSVATAKVSGDVDLAPGGAVRLDAQASQLISGTRTVSGLTLAARGTAERHTLAVTVNDPSDLPGGRVDLAVAGGLTGGIGPRSAWRGDITRLDLHADRTGNWSLERPAPLAVSQSDLRLDGFCWRSGGARLCASASRVKAGPWSAQATLAALPLKLLQPSLPAGASIRGDVNGTLAARGGASGLDQATIDVAPGPGELVYPAEEGKTVTVAFERGTIRAVTGAGGGQATADIKLTKLGEISGQVRLPRLGAGVVVARQPLAGRVGVHLSDLGFAAAFSPALRSVGGSLQADFDLGGTFGAPRLSGQAKLANGRAKVPEYGLDIHDFTLTAAGNGSNGVLQVNGSARSGKGTLAIAGQASLEPSAATPVHLKITGRRFQVAGSKEMNVEVTPNLDFTYQGRLARLTGQVDVPYARIDVEKLKKKNNPVLASKDVVFVGGVAPKLVAAKPPTVVMARVRIVLGDDIDLKALGLAGKPTGSLLAIEQPGKPPTAIGEIEINQGTFKAYGQDLTIERGRLVFAGGPLDNPGVDLRAYRKADDGTTAGIEATGTLKAPQVTLWSDPVMTETEALAYLLLGHPLSQATPQEGSLLANAATSLELKGGNLIAKRLASRFGLESATIESTGGLDQAALVLGKYLSPRLYVSYGIGLFQSINTFRIRYIMNKQFTLQADSGQTTQGTGADILYTKEH
jgi:translocation and assembly module TamB